MRRRRKWQILISPAPLSEIQRIRGWPDTLTLKVGKDSDALVRALGAVVEGLTFYDLANAAVAEMRVKVTFEELGRRKRARLTKMPPLQEDVHACTMCGYCVPVCPAYQEAGWEGASPRGRIFALRQYEMRGPLDLLLRRHVKPGEEFARNAWECTGCGACEEVCPVDIPFDGLWDDVKAWMVSSGYARPELEPYLANVRETHNLYGEPAANRAAWLPPETVQSPTPEVVYWVGCAASYKKQQIAGAMVKILNV